MERKLVKILFAFLFSVLFYSGLLNAIESTIQNESKVIVRLNEFIDIIEPSIVKYPYKKIHDFLKNAKIKKSKGEHWDEIDFVESNTQYTITLNTYKDLEDQMFTLAGIDFDITSFNKEVLLNNFEMYKKYFTSKYGNPRYDKKKRRGVLQTAWTFKEDKKTLYVLAIKYSPKRKDKINAALKVYIRAISKDSLNEEN